MSRIDQLNVTGVLADDARLSYTPGTPPSAVLTFEIHPEKGMPYRVRQIIGTDPTAQMIAAAKAAVLRRGAPVRVYAKGLRAQSDHGVAALFMLDVTDVLPSPPEPRAITTSQTQEAHDAD